MLIDTIALFYSALLFDMPYHASPRRKRFCVTSALTRNAGNFLRRFHFLLLYRWTLAERHIGRYYRDPRPRAIGILPAIFFEADACVR